MGMVIKQFLLLNQRTLEEPRIQISQEEKEINEISTLCQAEKKFIEPSKVILA